MKYAFIALIAIYLISYGCSTDESEKATDSHEQTAAITLESTPQSETVAVLEEQEQAVAPTHEEQQQATETIVKGIIEEPAPTAEIVEQAPSDQVVEPQMVVMPCGRKIALTDIPPNAPCFNRQPQVIQNTAVTADNQQEMAAAMQEMVNTTNDMIQVTRQLVIATQAMLKASQGMTVKVDPTEEAQPAK